MRASRACHGVYRARWIILTFMLSLLTLCLLAQVWLFSFLGERGDMLTDTLDFTPRRTHAGMGERSDCPVTVGRRQICTTVSPTVDKKDEERSTYCITGH